MRRGAAAPLSLSCVALLLLIAAACVLFFPAHVAAQQQLSLQSLTSPDTAVPQEITINAPSTDVRITLPRLPPLPRLSGDSPHFSSSNGSSGSNGGTTGAPPAVASIRLSDLALPGPAVAASGGEGGGGAGSGRRRALTAVLGGGAGVAAPPQMPTLAAPPTTMGDLFGGGRSGSRLLGRKMLQLQPSSIRNHPQLAPTTKLGDLFGADGEAGARRRFRLRRRLVSRALLQLQEHAASGEGQQVMQQALHAPAASLADLGFGRRRRGMLQLRTPSAPLPQDQLEQQAQPRRFAGDLRLSDLAWLASSEPFAPQATNKGQLPPAVSQTPLTPAPALGAGG